MTIPTKAPPTESTTGGEIEAIRGRHDAATKGPCAYMRDSETFPWEIRTCDGFSLICTVDKDGPDPDADGAFLAGAHDDVGWLLAEVDRLRILGPDTEVRVTIEARAIASDMLAPITDAWKKRVAELEESLERMGKELTWATVRRDNAERALESIRVRSTEACKGTGLSPSNAEVVPEIVRILTDRLSAANGKLTAIRTALGNGDETLHPVGLDLAGAVERLAGERAAVVAYLKGDDEGRSGVELAVAIEAGRHREKA